MVLNRQFDQGGALPGDAFSWTRTVAAAPVYGSFVRVGGPSGEAWAAEEFGWNGAITRAPTFTDAQFDTRSPTPRAVEDFDDLWGARPARLLSGKLAPYVLQPGQTLVVRVNGTERTVTFQMRDFANIADARAEEVARVIDRALPGADAFMVAGARRVVIATTAAGIGTTLEVVGGTAASTFAFPASATGSDEEGGTFLRRAEFDLFNFAPGGEEQDAFALGWPVAKEPPVHNDAAAPDLRYDPLDITGRFTVRPADPFLPAAFLTSLNTYTLTADETFTAAGFPGETLTINWGT